MYLTFDFLRDQKYTMTSLDVCAALEVERKITY